MDSKPFKEQSYMEIYAKSCTDVKGWIGRDEMKSQMQIFSSSLSSVAEEEKEEESDCGVAYPNETLDEKVELLENETGKEQLEPQLKELSYFSDDDESFEPVPYTRSSFKTPCEAPRNEILHRYPLILMDTELLGINNDEILEQRNPKSEATIPGFGNYVPGQLLITENVSIAIDRETPPREEIHADSNSKSSEELSLQYTTEQHNMDHQNLSKQDFHSTSNSKSSEQISSESSSDKCQVEYETPSKEDEKCEMEPPSKEDDKCETEPPSKEDAKCETERETPSNEDEKCTTNAHRKFNIELNSLKKEDGTPEMPSFNLGPFDEIVEVYIRSRNKVTTLSVGNSEYDSQTVDNNKSAHSLLPMDKTLDPISESESFFIIDETHIACQVGSSLLRLQEIPSNPKVKKFDPYKSVSLNHMDFSENLESLKEGLQHGVEKLADGLAYGYSKLPALASSISSTYIAASSSISSSYIAVSSSLSSSYTAVSSSISSTYVAAKEVVNKMMEKKPATEHRATSMEDFVPTTVIQNQRMNQIDELYESIALNERMACSLETIPTLTKTEEKTTLNVENEGENETSEPKSSPLAPRIGRKTRKPKVKKLGVGKEKPQSTPLNKNQDTGSKVDTLEHKTAVASKTKVKHQNAPDTVNSNEEIVVRVKAPKKLYKKVETAKTSAQTLAQTIDTLQASSAQAVKVHSTPELKEVLKKSDSKSKDSKSTKPFKKPSISKRPNGTPKLNQQNGKGEENFVHVNEWLEKSNTSLTFVKPPISINSERFGSEEIMTSMIKPVVEDSNENQLFYFSEKMKDFLKTNGSKVRTQTPK